jgi:phosphoesterase RecJ-like protein
MVIKENFLKAVAKATNILISTHIYPDADGIGSQISLCMALKKKGKNVICCNEEELLSRYKYLDPNDDVCGFESLKENFKETPDLIIIVDTNTIFRTGKKIQQYAEEIACNLLYIDHHPCPETTKKYHCIDTKAAATGQLVGELIEYLEVPFDAQIALPLYTAILIDTSSFRYPTVTESTHRMIAKLMATGIKPTSAYNGIYGTKNIKHLHLLGKVLGSANSNESEDIAWIVLNKSLLAEYKTDIEDTHAFINHLLILDNIKVACMFREEGDNKLKVSLRSSGEYDVGLIAIGLGGGGHSHSAATLFEIPKDKSLEKVIEITVSKIEYLLASQTALKNNL